MVVVDKDCEIVVLASVKFFTVASVSFTVDIALSLIVDIVVLDKSAYVDSVVNDEYVVVVLYVEVGVVDKNKVVFKYMEMFTGVSKFRVDDTVNGLLEFEKVGLSIRYVVSSVDLGFIVAK